MKRRIALGFCYTLAIAIAIYLGRISVSKSESDPAPNLSITGVIPPATPMPQSNSEETGHYAPADSKTKPVAEKQAPVVNSITSSSASQQSNELDLERAGKSFFAAGDIWDRVKREHGYTDEARSLAVEEIRKLYGVRKVAWSAGETQIDVIFQNGFRATIDAREMPKNGDEWDGVD